MSVVLIHVAGATICSVIVGLWAKDMLEKSKVKAPEDEPFPVTTELVGLGIQMAGYGLDRFDEKVDWLFESTPAQWIKTFLAPSCIRPDGVYLIEKPGYEIDYWKEKGYTDEKKIKSNPYEMEI